MYSQQHSKNVFLRFSQNLKNKSLKKVIAGIEFTCLGHFKLWRLLIYVRYQRPHLELCHKDLTLRRARRNAKLIRVMFNLLRESAHPCKLFHQNMGETRLPRNMQMLRLSDEPILNTVCNILICNFTSQKYFTCGMIKEI